jgi:hypothetical protein
MAMADQRMSDVWGASRCGEAMPGGIKPLARPGMTSKEVPASDRVIAAADYKLDMKRGRFRLCPG